MEVWKCGSVEVFFVFRYISLTIRETLYPCMSQKNIKLNFSLPHFHTSILPHLFENIFGMIVLRLIFAAAF